MPRTKVDPQELHVRLWAALHRDGFHASSLSSLSAAAGIGKAGLLHHFGSKEGLVRAVIEWAREQFRAYVLAAFAKTGLRPNGTSWTLEARLAEGLRRQFRLVRRDAGGCFFGNAILELGGESPYGEGLRGFLDDWLAAATELLAERYDRAEAAERAYRLFADYQGTVIYYRATGDRSHLDRFAARALASLDLPLSGAITESLTVTATATP